MPSTTSGTALCAWTVRSKRVWPRVIGKWPLGAREMAGEERGEHDLSHLKIALQCGGSDAFSGISGNPLAAWVARELIRYGGAANLAETDELIGAEPYVLQNVKDVETARTFLQMVEHFKERVSWHGALRRGQPLRGQQISRPLQYRAQVHWCGAQARPGRALGLRH